MSWRNVRLALVVCVAMALWSCGNGPWNNPYPASEAGRNTLYTSFVERPKHLDPAVSYSENEYAIIAQIYEPPLQYHYLKRPYQLVPLAASALPEVRYFDSAGAPLPDSSAADSIAYSEYRITLRDDLWFQPHPAFARNAQGQPLYHALSPAALEPIRTLGDFAQNSTRRVTAEDYAYQIKRLVHPQLHSPIAEVMKQHIVGLHELAEQLEAAHAAAPDKDRWLDIRAFPLSGVTVIDDRTYAIRIHGKYPQFRYWLAMLFFAPMPWEADLFYAQPGLIEKNIVLDWYPVGSGAYRLEENNPNRRMVLTRNPNYHGETYPDAGDPGDAEKDLLADANQPLPFIDRVIHVLEKESIPYWNKFLQGYYDASGIVSDNFDQAIQFAGSGNVELTPDMQAKGIRLETAVMTSIFYMGFNMLDPVIGGLDEARCKLRQALAIAVDYEEFIAIFTNGRGVPSQGPVPPGIFGNLPGVDGLNRYLYTGPAGRAVRKDLAEARQLLAEAGYPDGRDRRSGKPLALYLDTVSSGADSSSILDWYRKQFAKLGIQLILRVTDYNQFQQKVRNGNAQIYTWGWNADYPDPENFFFLLYGPNGKVKNGGENTSNYSNPRFDALFERMRNMDDTPERLAIIRTMQDIVTHDAPWLFGLHPKSFALYHSWYRNLKPNLMANNNLKYQRIDPSERDKRRAAWNRPIVWPLCLGAVALGALFVPAWLGYRRRAESRAL